MTYAKDDIVEYDFIGVSGQKTGHGVVTGFGPIIGGKPQYYYITDTISKTVYALTEKTLRPLQPATPAIPAPSNINTWYMRGDYFTTTKFDDLARETDACIKALGSVWICFGDGGATLFAPQSVTVEPDGEILFKKGTHNQGRMVAGRAGRIPPLSASGSAASVPQRSDAYNFFATSSHGEDKTGDTYAKWQEAERKKRGG